MSLFNLFFTKVAEAQTEGYKLLEPSVLNRQEGSTADLKTFVYEFFTMFMIIAASLSVVMIVIGGIQYIFSTVPGTKSTGKERIKNALGGLLLALVAYVILYTINPQLVNFDMILNTTPTPAQ